MYKIFKIVVFLTCLATFSKSEDRILDLTWDFDENKTVYWPKVQPFVFTKEIASTDKGFWYSAKEFCAGEHGGTHFDAPYHFNFDGWKVAEVPVQRLFAKGACIDLSEETKSLGANATLKIRHLENWEKTHGPFENGTVLLVKFGWSQFWTNNTKYLGLDINGNLNFPGVSEAAANWIVNKKSFYGVGLDTPSIDSGNSRDLLVHRVFAKHQLYNLENVKLIENLPAIGFDLIISPMKLTQGTGAPTRIFAIHCDIKND